MPPKPKPKPTTVNKPKVTPTSSSATQTNKTPKLSLAEAQRMQAFFQKLWNPQTGGLHSDHLSQLMSNDDDAKMIIAALNETSFFYFAASTIQEFARLQMRQTRTTLPPSLIRFFSSGLLKEMVKVCDSKSPELAHSIVLLHQAIFDLFHALSHPQSPYVQQFCQIVMTPAFFASLLWWFQNDFPGLGEQGGMVLKLGTINLFFLPFNAGVPIPLRKPVVDLNMFDYSIYAQFLLNAKRLSQKYLRNPLYLLCEIFKMKPCTNSKDQLLWIKLLMNIADGASRADCHDAALITLNNLYPSTSDSNQQGEWVKAVLGNDGGKRLFTICCRSTRLPRDIEDDPATLLSNALSPALTILDTYAQHEAIHGKSFDQVFDLVWECGLGELFIQMNQKAANCSTTLEFPRGCCTILGIFVQHAPLKYFERYPNFLSTTIVSAYDYAKKWAREDEQALILAYFVDGMKKLSAPRLDLYAKSPITSRIFDIIVETSPRMVFHFQSINNNNNNNVKMAGGKFDGKFDSTFVHLAITFINYVALCCGRAHANSHDAIPYNAFDLLIGWSRNVSFMESMKTILKIWETTPPQSLGISALFIKASDNEIIFMLNLIISVCNSLAESVAKSSKERLVVVDDDVDIDAAAPCKGSAREKTTIYEEKEKDVPEPKQQIPTPQQTQVPSPKKLQQQKVEARRAKMQKEPKQKGGPEEMD